MMNSLKTFITMLAFTIFIIAVIGLLMKTLGTNNFINLIFALNLIICMYFMLKNGIKKDDFKWLKIKKGYIQYGGVALVWFFIFGIAWVILLYIRINKVS